MDIYTESNNKRSFENNGKYSESTRVAINHILWNKKYSIDVKAGLI